jgi:hypothetical protein
MSWQGWLILIGGSWLVLGTVIAISLSQAFKFGDIRAAKMHKRRKDEK